tara:strand:- start:3214 stop:3696 length:483 start_codon:yes stop_codon:yes gene_type:complete
MEARYFYSNKCLESNFYLHPFQHDGVTLPTAEHHLMRQKALLMGDGRVARTIEKAQTPRAAKLLGRKVGPWNQSRWDTNCDKIMEDILVSKFTSSKRMKDYLLGIVGDFYEASPRDKIWGIGISVKDAENGVAHKPGCKNKLGQALNRARVRVANVVAIA